MDSFQEQTTRLLTRSILYCAEVLALTQHAYLQRNLQETLETVIREALSDPDSVYSSAGLLQRSLEEISLVGAAPIQKMLLAERHVLLLQLHLKSVREHSARVERGTRATNSKSGNQSSSDVSGRRVTDTMKQVLTCIQKNQPAQAKDVIAKCSSLSQRTVKRRLRDLLETGMIIKKISDGITLYEASKSTK